MIHHVAIAIYKHGVVVFSRIAVHIFLNYLVQDEWTHHKVTVFLPFLVIETEIGYQSLLASARTLGTISLDEQRRQCLLEQAYFVDVAREGILLIEFQVASFLPYHVSKVEIVASHTAQRVCGERRPQFVVDVNVCHLVRTVYGHRIMVPTSIAPLTEFHFHAVCTVFQVFAFETDEEFVLGKCIGGLTSTVAQHGSTTVSVGLEPEHQRVVIL